MMIKQCAVVAGVAAAAAVLSAPVAYAVDDLNCADFATPVVIVDGHDPDGLDADNDGIGCEDNAGEPAAYEKYTAALADTGVSDVINRHPLRAYGAAALTVVAGTATIVVVRRRTRLEGN
jgi:hypothetical protein